MISQEAKKCVYLPCLLEYVVVKCAVDNGGITFFRTLRTIRTRVLNVLTNRYFF